jgi:hypothetical protein
MADDGAASFARALTLNASLTALDLSNNQIGEHGALQLSVALKNSAVRSFSLSANNIGAKGALGFAHLLEANTTLVSLNLAACLIGMDGVAPIPQRSRRTRLWRLCIYLGTASRLVFSEKNRLPSKWRSTPHLQMATARCVSCKELWASSNSSSAISVTCKHAAIR